MDHKEVNDDQARTAKKAKWIVKGLIVSMLSVWALYWIIYPIPDGSTFLGKLNVVMKSSFIGTPGSLFLLQAAPVFLSTLLTFLFLKFRDLIPSSHNWRLAKGDKPHRFVWSTPVFIRSPLGILTLGNIVFIFFILFISMFPTIKGTVDNLRGFDYTTFPDPGWTLRMYVWSIYLAQGGLVSFAMLWIPVSRGSPLLKFIGVPFEQAVRYHTWLAQLASSLFVAHGLTYIIALRAVNLESALFTWPSKGTAGLPALLATIGFILIWLTSLPYVRRRHFEIFYVSHHLYIPLMILSAAHCVYIVYFYIFPVLLFFIDRFMRYVQSQKQVDVLSARILPSGAIELTFAKPANVTYNPLSIVFLLLPSVSNFEWHPFSVTSSALDGQKNLSIIVKPVTGGWTSRLHSVISSAAKHQHLLETHSDSKIIKMAKCPFSFKASLEGPYGDETNFFLKYRSLVLVAGGIGITPFLAILRDILYRYKRQTPGTARGTLPESIELFYSVRTPPELTIINTVDPFDILPDWETHVTIQVHGFVTAKTEDSQDRELDKDCRRKYTNLKPFGKQEEWSIIELNDKPSLKIPNQAGDLVRSTTFIDHGQGIEELSPVRTGGHNTWVFAITLVTIIAFIFIWGVASENFVFNYNDPRWRNYSEVTYIFGSVALAVVICGGSVVFLWYFSTRGDATSTDVHKSVDKTDEAGKAKPDAKSRKAGKHYKEDDSWSCSFAEEDEEMGSTSSPWQGTLRLGKRPVWKDEFDILSKRFKGQEVAVLASGPAQLVGTVAENCRQRTSEDVAFHFHSVSFEF